MIKAKSTKRLESLSDSVNKHILLPASLSSKLYSLYTKVMKITFLGACREVTGSNFLLEAAGKKILLDCGIFQGSKFAEEKNFESFAYNPREIDFVILGHAHLDHCSRLPKLVKDGFCGRIYATAPTKELTKLVLDDSEKLAQEEARRDNHPPLFTQKEIDRVMDLFEAISYEETIQISEQIKITLKNAGHILGSALTLIESENKKIVYTSDLGNVPSELLDPPSLITDATYVICEATYGGRIHEDSARREQKLAEIINLTVAQNGVLMIPTFAIERTQELLHDIEHFCAVSNCEKPTFYLDSPLATKVTKVFEKYPEYLSKTLNQFHKNEDFFGLEHLQITQTHQQSEAIDELPNPKVIIAGSGMLNGGRIIFHAQKYLSDAKNTLLIVGYQPIGGLGRRLIEGAHEVKILGKNIRVKAKIESIRSYSAHADLPQLLGWLGNIKGCKKIFLVHGETDQMLTFSKAINNNLKIETVIPQYGERYEL